MPAWKMQFVGRFRDSKPSPHLSYGGLPIGESTLRVSVLCSGEPSDSWRSLKNTDYADLAVKAMTRLHGMFGDGMTGR